MKAEWYLAELVMKITVAEDPRNVVHQNLVLVRASAPDEAYEKALEFGKAAETSYDNPAGKAVEIKFEGLSDLVEIDEDLEDGAETAFRYKVDVPDDQLQALVLSRDRLPAFLPPRRAEGPDYASGEIAAEVERRFGIRRPEFQPRN